MIARSLIALTLMAGPALAATGPFFSLKNTDFVVLLGFIVFIGVLLYFKVPSMITGLLDQRADGIKSELDEARALREEAQALLASYERKQAEVSAEADRIVTQAKEQAALAAEQAKEELKSTIARRLQTAEEQIASAEAEAVKAVRDQAVNVAIAAASEVIAGKISTQQGNKLIEDAIGQVQQKLH